MLNSDTMKYKTRVASMLCDNQDIVEALDAKDPNEELMYHTIFPHIYIPGVEELSRTVICYGLDFPRIDKRNEYFKDSNLVFYVISHRDHMKTTYGGTRTDVLEGLIVKMFGWNINLGLELKLKSSVEKIINDTYHSRIIVFETLAFNNLDCGIKHGSR